MTALLDPRPLEDPAYWDTTFYGSLNEFCDLVADYLEREFGWNDIREELRSNYYCQREYGCGSSIEETAKLVYVFDLTWED